MKKSTYLWITILEENEMLGVVLLFIPVNGIIYRCLNFLVKWIKCTKHSKKSKRIRILFF